MAPDGASRAGGIVTTTSPATSRAGSRASTGAGPRPTLLAVSLVLVATIAGCSFNSPTPAPSAGASGAIPTVPSSPGTSPDAGPSASPETSATPPVPTGAVKPTPCPGSNRDPGAAAGRQYTGGSTNWSGYVSAVKKTGVTCVEASWVEPSVTCPKTGRQAVAIWIGIDGFAAKPIGIPSTDVLVQIGTQVTCTDGVAVHGAWHEILPGEPREVPIAAQISPGDHMSAKISYANDRFTLVLYDQEAEGLYSLTAPAPGAPRKTAEWIVEAPATDCPGSCTPLPLPKFSTVRFTNAYTTIAGQRASINDASWSNVKLKMVRSGITRTTVSTFASGGTSVRVFWAHS